MMKDLSQKMRRYRTESCRQSGGVKSLAGVSPDIREAIEFFRTAGQPVE